MCYSRKPFSLLIDGPDQKSTKIRILARFLSFLAVLGLVSAAAPGLAWSAQATLAWDANNPVPDGYRLFRRTEGQSYNYSQPVWTGAATTCTISNLTDGTAYYFVVRACVGNEESGNSNEVIFTSASTNQPPIAQAGQDQSVHSQALVTLNGSGSHDPEGDALAYAWQQTSGTAVQFSSSSAIQPDFTAPAVSGNPLVLVFRLTVTDSHGLSTTGTCTVEVLPPLGPVDSDGDGMTDAWETSHGLNPLSDDAGLDPDGDGLSNFEEYQAGSDPNLAQANQPPDQPEVTLGENDPTQVTLTPWLYSSAFSDPDLGDSHRQSQWRIIESDTLRVIFKRTSSRYLTSLHVPRLVLDPGTDYLCEVRYYDQNNLASDWSSQLSFTTAGLSNDRNNNGVVDTGERAIHSDLNGDGIADSEQTELLRSVQNPASLQVAGISIEQSAEVESIVYGLALEPDMLDPDMETLQTTGYGVIGYKLHMAEPGQSTDVILYFMQALDPMTSWVCLNGEFEKEDCTDVVDWLDEGQAAIRSLTDGGEGDADGEANGIIVDFIAPLQAEETRPDQSVGNPEISQEAQAAQAGGCFIGSLMR